MSSAAATAKKEGLSDAQFERLKAELVRELITAVREELGRMQPAPANDDGMLTTEQAMAHCGFDRRKTFLMHITRGNLKPDSFAQRGRFKEHRFTKATLDRFMRTKGKGKE